MLCFPPCSLILQPALTQQHDHVASDSVTQQNLTVAFADLNVTACTDAELQSSIWLSIYNDTFVRHSALLCTAKWFGAYCKYTLQSVQCSFAQT